jgi:hypothetical protein
MISFQLGGALFAFCFAMRCIEVLLEVDPGLVLRCCLQPVVTVIVVDAAFVDYGVGGVDNLLVREGSVASLSICLDVLDAAVESLDWLAGIPCIIETFCVGS